jgi:hypothetical protein
MQRVQGKGICFKCIVTLNGEMEESVTSSSKGSDYFTQLGMEGKTKETY